MNSSSIRGAGLWLACATLLTACGRDVPVVDTNDLPEQIRRPTRWSENVLDAARAIPLQHEGRVKPADTLAAFTLYAIHGRRDMKFTFGKQKDKLELSPTEWLLDVWCFPQEADRYPLFRIENAEVFRSLWPDKEHFQRQDLEYVSFESVRLVYDRLDPLVRDLLKNKRETKFMEPGEQALVHLHEQLGEYFAVRQAVEPLQRPYVLNGDELQALFGGKDHASVAEVLDQAPAIAALGLKLRSKPDSERGTATIIADELSGLSQETNGPALFPPVNRADEKWLTYGDVVRHALVGQLAPQLRELVARLEAVVTQTNDDMPSREEAILAYQSAVARATDARGEYDPVALESRYYKWSLSYQALHWFLTGFLVVAVYWLAIRARWAGWVAIAGFAVTLVGECYLVGDIVLRCMITHRPPIKNLFDTFLFICAIGVLAALITELVSRRRIALSLAPIMGTLLIMFARMFEVSDGQDTMKQLQAVLDSNYWLATHVTTINIGYAAGMLAMLLGNAWLLLHAFRVDRRNPAFQKSLARMTYGVVCFGLLFSVVGTILGGVWANDSWGRFWGWDPKENGALLICLSEIALLHARMSGWVRDFGFSVWAGVTGIAVGFSWFHVNLLGVGLHAYGFSAGLHRGVWTFYGCELAVLLVGAIGHWLWSASTQSARAPAAGAALPASAEPAAK